MKAAAGEEALVEAVAGQVLTPDKRNKLKVHQRSGLCFEQSYPSRDLGLLCLPSPSPSPFSANPLAFPTCASPRFVCVYVYVCACVRVCVFVFVHARASTLHAFLYTHIHTQMCIHMYACDWVIEFVSA